MSYLNYRIKTEDDGRSVLNILRFDLGLSTAKIRSVKWEEEGILLDGVRVTVRTRVSAGQLLQVLMEDSSSRQERIIPTPMELDILYEDDDLLLLNKPAGIVCHPSRGHRTDSLANGAAAYFREKNERSSVHLLGRLDKDTTGILAIAKNGVAAQRMIDARRQGRIEKEYLAIVEGHMEKSFGQIRIPMEAWRDPADGLLKMHRVSPEKSTKKSQAGTTYEVLRLTERFSLCRVRIETGKMHQIRFHMSQIGHPLAGDPLYGKGPDDIIARTALHAHHLKFLHPVSREPIDLRVDLPEDMQACLS